MITLQNIKEIQGVSLVIQSKAYLLIKEDTEDMMIDCLHTYSLLKEDNKYLDRYETIIREYFYYTRNMPILMVSVNNIKSIIEDNKTFYKYVGYVESDINEEDIYNLRKIGCLCVGKQQKIIN